MITAEQENNLCPHDYLLKCKRKSGMIQQYLAAGNRCRRHSGNIHACGNDEPVLPPVEPCRKFGAKEAAHAEAGSAKAVHLPGLFGMG